MTKRTLHYTDFHQLFSKIIFTLLILSCSGLYTVQAQPRDSEDLDFKPTSNVDSNKQFYPHNDSILKIQNHIHTLTLENRTGFLIPTKSLYEGNKNLINPFKTAQSIHLKYAFHFPSGSTVDKIFGGVYQGIGIACYSFNNHQQLGNPIVAYLFQGARITTISPTISLNYEWNFGLSGNWHPYNYMNNSDNTIIGSKINAYLNANFYFKWILSSQFNLSTGIAFTHFSNGNTKFPNAGLNAATIKIGINYKLKPNSVSYRSPKNNTTNKFEKQISYDLVFFGAWRKTSVNFQDQEIASPDTYSVWGFNFNPMIDMGYKLRLGLSLDAAYDGGANVYTDQNVKTPKNYYQPSFENQTIVGLSGRVEYVMPYFSVNMGVGRSLFGKKDLNSSYQILALKITVSRKTFIHIGYSLKDFHNPNFLMLGFGLRFHNRYPRL